MKIINALSTLFLLSFMASSLFCSEITQAAVQMDISLRDISQQLNSLYEVRFVSNKLTAATLNDHDFFIPLLNCLQKYELTGNHFKQLKNINIFFEQARSHYTQHILSCIDKLELQGKLSLTTIDQQVLPSIIQGNLRSYLIEQAYSTISHNYEVVCPHEEPIKQWDLCKDKLFVSVTASNKIFLWDLVQATKNGPVHTTDSIEKVKLSSDGTYTFIVFKNRSDRTFLAQLNNTTLKLEKTWTNTPPIIHLLLNAPKNSIIVVGSQESDNSWVQHTFTQKSEKPAIEKLNSVNIISLGMPIATKNVALETEFYLKDNAIISLTSRMVYFFSKIIANSKTKDLSTIFNLDAYQQLSPVEKNEVKQLIIDKEKSWSSFFS